MLLGNSPWSTFLNLKSRLSYRCCTLFPVAPTPENCSAPKNTVSAQQQRSLTPFCLSGFIAAFMLPRNFLKLLQNLCRFPRILTINFVIYRGNESHRIWLFFRLTTFAASERFVGTVLWRYGAALSRDANHAPSTQKICQSGAGCEATLPLRLIKGWVHCCRKVLKAIRHECASYRLLRCAT